MALTEEEVQLADALLGRVGKLAAAASEKGVRLMIDAEHTYFQPVRMAHVQPCAKQQRMVPQPCMCVLIHSRGTAAIVRHHGFGVRSHTASC